MRHKRLLFGSIITLAVGIVMYFIGMLILPFGVESYTTGWWIFSETHYYYTSVGYLALALAYGGITLSIVGILATVITLIWEATVKLTHECPRCGKTVSIGLEKCPYCKIDLQNTGFGANTVKNYTIHILIDVHVVVHMEKIKSFFLTDSLYHFKLH